MLKQLDRAKRVLEDLPEGIEASINVYPRSIYIYFWIGDLTASELRKVKELYGPFIPEGEPPNVRLRVEQMEEEEDAYYHTYIEIQGAYSCEISHTYTEHKELSASERESLKKQIEETQNQLEAGHRLQTHYAYDCKPAQPKPDEEFAEAREQYDEIPTVEDSVREEMERAENDRRRASHPALSLHPGEEEADAGDS